MHHNDQYQSDDFTKTFTLLKYIWRHLVANVNFAPNKVIMDLNCNHLSTAGGMISRVFKHFYLFNKI